MSNITFKGIPVPFPSLNRKGWCCISNGKTCNSKSYSNMHATVRAVSLVRVLVERQETNTAFLPEVCHIIEHHIIFLYTPHYSCYLHAIP